MNSMRYCPSCFRLLAFCIMIGVGAMNALTRSFSPLLSARGCRGMLFYQNAGVTEKFQSSRSLFTMKLGDSRPPKKVETGTGKPRSTPAKLNPTRSSSSVSKGPPKQDLQQKSDADGVRLNKCLHGLSRRGADDAIAEGRVTINNAVATNGMKVKKRDIVRLDGKMQHWEGAAEAKKAAPSSVLEDRSFVYVKYWKPVGVTCTSDPSDKTNIIKAGQFDLFPQRLFTVGRLDKDSTGLILLTSDGRVNQAMLSPATKREKVYKVEFNKAPTNDQILTLAEGVMITTIAQRDSRTATGGSKSATPLTAKTKPCKVSRIGQPTSKLVEITLIEGRNRQIRKMAEALGLLVVKLHRVSFAGISLKGLSEGNWAEFSEREMEVVQTALAAQGTISSSRGGGEEEEEYE